MKGKKLDIRPFTRQFYRGNGVVLRVFTVGNVAQRNRQSAHLVADATVD